ncbi:MAG: heat-inducible transcription repressor HrcA [Clostridia bacterium]|jgi:heat-inducible transcriptional repressor|nr:heat-inducible transcription repressor HrcA [Clostridia bacterium]
MKNKEFSDRRKKILESVVDSYISEGEPVSSSTIRDKYFPDISSATIRNELALLEDMGYLMQPHISAGRIPSSLAYRYYVDNLLTLDNEAGDLDELKERFDTHLSGVEEIVRNTAKVISDVTNYTSVVVLNPLTTVINRLKLVDLGDGSALVIIVTDAGIIRDQLIEIDGDMTEDYLNQATKILNEIFNGRTLGEIRDNDDMVDERISDYRRLFEGIIDVLKRYREKSGKQVYLEGTNKIFDYKEYEDVDNVKNFMSVIDAKDKLHELIEENNDIEFSVKIGKEEGDGLTHMALVTAKYSINGKEIGHAGVIGPERMDYKKVIKVLGQISSTLKTLSEDKLIESKNKDKKQ